MSTATMEVGQRWASLSTGIEWRVDSFDGEHAKCTVVKKGAQTAYELGDVRRWSPFDDRTMRLVAQPRTPRPGQKWRWTKEGDSDEREFYIIGESYKYGGHVDGPAYVVEYIGGALSTQTVGSIIRFCTFVDPIEHLFDGVNSGTFSNMLAPPTAFTAETMERAIKDLDAMVKTKVPYEFRYSGLAPVPPPPIKPPATAREIIQLRAKTPEPWQPSVDEWDLLPDAGR